MTLFCLSLLSQASLDASMFDGALTERAAGCFSALPASPSTKNLPDAADTLMQARRDPPEWPNLDMH